MKNEEILLKIRKLIDMFSKGEIVQEHQHEVNPGLGLGTRENYLYFTLPVCINYQRSSPAMWQSALNTYNDSDTIYLFLPEEVAERSFDILQKDLLKYKLALQKNKHTQIWQVISLTLHDFYENDPVNILKEGDFDVEKIIRNLRVIHKKRFPYLSGSKMSNYWLYILHHYTDVKLKNLNMISIIPDTHVQQSSIVLGLTTPSSTPEEVSSAWFELLSGTDIMPIDMHPILWNWSRSGFPTTI